METEGLSWTWGVVLLGVAGALSLRNEPTPVTTIGCSDIRRQRADVVHHQAAITRLELELAVTDDDPASVRNGRRRLLARLRADQQEIERRLSRIEVNPRAPECELRYLCGE